MSNGEEIVRRILQPSAGDDRGRLANDLLKALFDGYAIGNLRRLLSSTDTEVLKHGIWIASELGARGAELLSDVVPLLTNPSQWVRFFSLDCVTTYGGDDDGSALGHAMACLRDVDEGVRAKATAMLLQVHESRLRAALHYFEGHSSKDFELVNGLRSLLRSEEATGLLGSSSAVLRKFGLVAAGRCASWRAALLVASESDDPEVKALARRELQLREASGTASRGSDG